MAQQNIAYATVHKDEYTPHMHLGVVPMRDGKLQGKNVFNRQELLWLQDEFPKHMQKQGFDLQRGEEGSKTEHLNTAKFKLEKTKEQQVSLEKKISDKKNELLVLNEKIAIRLRYRQNENLKKLKLRAKKKIYLVGRKIEIKKKPTGNVVMAEADFKKIMAAARDNKRLKNGLQTLVKTDLFQENEKLGKALGKTKKDLETVKGDLQTKTRENEHLKSQVVDLKREIQMIYESAKEYLKERTEGLQAFRSLFRGLVDKVKGKTTGSEFERLHKRERRLEQNREMER